MTKAMLCISVAEALTVGQLAIAQALQRVTIERIIYLTFFAHALKISPEPYVPLSKQSA
jgi:hypothetical protein